MSQIPARAMRRMPRLPELPRGEIISTYDRYEDAMRAIDRLVHANFPADAVSVVGNDLRSVERVTGKLSYARVAWMAALSGAYLGLFLGLLLFLFQSGQSGAVGIFAAAVVIGAGFGMLFGVLSYAMNRNRRAFSSVMQFVASRYDLVTAPELLLRARNILSTQGES